jgi:hypothetical protein
VTKGQRNALVLVAIGSIVGIVFGFSLGQTGSAKVNLPAPFVSVYPTTGDFDLRQTTINVVVRAGYTADLEIDGKEVVEDDVRRVESLHSVTYQPKPDSDIGHLGAGRHCVSARARGETDHLYDNAVYRWCFNLH